MVSGPDYEGLYADIGTKRRNPDGHAWARCSLKGSLDDPTNPLHISLPQPLPDRTIPVPFVLTGDKAFGLAKYMLRPYKLPTEKFNSRRENLQLPHLKR